MLQNITGVLCLLTSFGLLFSIREDENMTSGGFKFIFGFGLAITGGLALFFDMIVTIYNWLNTNLPQDGLWTIFYAHVLNSIAWFAVLVGWIAFSMGTGYWFQKQYKAKKTAD
jgi:hypothetical protein